MRTDGPTVDQKGKLKVSVIILNYNYAQFVADAIKSCLNQEYPAVETIVVDDGSTDDSRKIIDKFTDQVIKIYQPNRGVAEASNAGFDRSSGDVIIFLDADDYLYQEAVRTVVEQWRPGIAKVHYRVRTVGPRGEEFGYIPPVRVSLSEGDVWREILSTGTCETPPMSGNAYARDTLEQLFPIRDARVNDSGTYYDYVPTDGYLRLRAPAFGPVVAIAEPLAAKRLHGANNKGRSPYVNVLKRHRTLKLVRLNAKFINERLGSEPAEWDGDLLLAKEKLIRLRMLSFRFDGSKHPWPDDNRLRIMRVFLKNWRRLDGSGWLKLIHGFGILGLLAVLPKRSAEIVLKANAILAGRKTSF